MTAAQCAAWARAALEQEVSVTPKPGLVDLRNNGAHRDMDHALFLRSAAVLEPWFRRFFEMGAAQPLDGLMPALRREGIRAEREMLAATGGVNTHRGALFTMGLFCAACGAVQSTGQPVTAECLCGIVARLTRGVTAELPQADTHGGRAYLQTGSLGIRGEAERGYPAVREIALPVLRARLDVGDSLNDAAVYALICLISRVGDTNLVARGGAEGAAWARAQAERLRTQWSLFAVYALDDAFIARDLSPGGCADLLAAALFLRTVEAHAEARDAVGIPQ